MQINDEEYKNLKKIIGEQEPDSFYENYPIFKKMLEEHFKQWGFADLVWLLGTAYLYGRMEGIRAERKRRKQKK